MMFINGPTLHSVEKYRTALGLAADSDNLASGYGSSAVTTLVARYSPKTLKATGRSVRLTLQGFQVTGRTVTLSNVTIALAATANTAKPYDAATTPTAVTFGGSASVSLSQGGRRISDDITFTLDGTSFFLIAYNVAATGGGYVSYKTGLSVNNYSTYYKSSVSEAGTATKAASYSLSQGISPFLLKLECL